MKNFFRVTMLGLLMVVMTAVSASSIMAQTPEEIQKQKTDLYNTFAKYYSSENIEGLQKALDAANEYVAKFPKDTEQVEYYKKYIPFLEQNIKGIKEKAIKEKLRKEREARFKRFNEAYPKAVKEVNVANWNEVFDATEAVINNDKEFALDAKILLASGGSIYLPGGKTPIDTFNNKILMYAEDVIKDIDAGKTSKTYGLFNRQLNTKDAALAEMNEVIGFIKFDRQGKKEDGVVYYYKSLDYQKDLQTYRKIGSWYIDNYRKITDKRKPLSPKNEADLPLIKNYLAMERGYLERAIDSYARAYDVAKGDPKVPAEAKTALLNRVKELFTFRYSQPWEANMKSDMKINSYLAVINAKNMPNPTTAVQPIAIEDPSIKVETPATTDGDAKSDVKKDDAKKPAAKNGTTRSRTVSKTAKSGN